MWQAAQTIFLSIVLESLPFILLGVLISSLIQELISQDKMLHLLPKNKVWAVLVSSLLGFVMPVCDCGTVPVARSLIRKGVPHAAAMAFTLAAPVVNPLTMIATYVAFGMNTQMMWTRTATTLGIAVAIGWTLLYLERKPAKRKRYLLFELPMLEIASTAVTSRPKRKLREVTGSVIEHAIIEFFEVGVFVVASAAVAALLQTFAPKTLLATIGYHPVWSVLGMMTLAVLLSLCSEADAFVARSLAGLTTSGGVLAFLVIGQMIDIRNLFLLPKVFPRRIVIRTFLLAVVLVLYVGVSVDLL